MAFWSMRILSFACAIAFLLAGAPTGTAGPDLIDDDAGSGGDAGDTKADALPIGPGTYTGHILPGVDPHDWYALEVPAGHGFDVASILPPEFRLRSPGVTVVAPDGEEQYFLSGVRGFFSNEDATWHLRFDARVFLNGEYTFSVALVDRPAQDDAGSGRDAWHHAPVALTEGAYSATLDPYDRRDTYTIDVVGKQVVDVKVRPLNGTGIKVVLDDGSCCTGREGRSFSSSDFTATFQDTEVVLDLQILHKHDRLDAPYELELDLRPVDGLHDLNITALEEHHRPLVGTKHGDVPNDVAETRRIDLVVANTGDTRSPSLSHVAFGVLCDDCRRPFHVLEDAWIGALEPGEETTVSFDWDTTLYRGDQTLFAWVDMHNIRPEIDEENNLRSHETDAGLTGIW